MGNEPGCVSNIDQSIDRNARIPPLAALLSRPYSINNLFVWRWRFSRLFYCCLRPSDPTPRIIIPVFDVAGYEKEENMEREIKITLRLWMEMVVMLESVEHFQFRHFSSSIFF